MNGIVSIRELNARGQRCAEKNGAYPGATTPWIETLLASPDANSHDHAGRVAGGVEDNADPETPGGDTRDD